MSGSSAQRVNRKGDLPAGPWNDEPDRVEFEHAGLPCILLRGESGSLCGYAAVSPGHSWYGLSYSAELVDVEVHGGLTYSEKCMGDVCHISKPGEPEDVWWFGFDASHLFDIVPRWVKLGIHRPLLRGECYRDWAYMRRQTELLAEQLAAAAAPAYP